MAFIIRTTDPKAIIMSIFNTDTARNIAIGFILGAIALTVQSGPELWSPLVPEAAAAIIG